MKVITLKQPWATLIAEGYKKYEFRSWKINYRGVIYIHAGKGVDKVSMKRFESLNLEYPSSRILAKVTISDCILLDEEIKQKIERENELVYGSSMNRDGYAWKLDNITKINCSKNINGKLGILTIDDIS